VALWGFGDEGSAQPEVRKLHFVPGFGDQEVLELEVSVQDVIAVAVFESGQHLPEEQGALGLGKSVVREEAFFGVVVIGHHMIEEAAAFYELHNDINSALGLDDLQHLGDVLVC